MENAKFKKIYPLQNKINIGLGLSLIMNTWSRYPMWVHLNLRINAWFLNISMEWDQLLILFIISNFTANERVENEFKLFKLI